MYKKPNAVKMYIIILSGQNRPKFVIFQLNGAIRCTPIPHLVCRESKIKCKNEFMLRIANVRQYVFEKVESARLNIKEKNKEDCTIAYNRRS
jgi:hypothetical protein